MNKLDEIILAEALLQNTMSQSCLRLSNIREDVERIRYMLPVRVPVALNADRQSYPLAIELTQAGVNVLSEALNEFESIYRDKIREVRSLLQDAIKKEMGL